MVCADFIPSHEICIKVLDLLASSSRTGTLEQNGLTRGTRLQTYDQALNGAKGLLMEKSFYRRELEKLRCNARNAKDNAAESTALVRRGLFTLRGGSDSRLVRCDPATWTARTGKEHDRGEDDGAYG
jgi:hypothetical protein